MTSAIRGSWQFAVSALAFVHCAMPGCMPHRGYTAMVGAWFFRGDLIAFFMVVGPE